VHAQHCAPFQFVYIDYADRRSGFTKFLFAPAYTLFTPLNVRFFCADWRRGIAVPRKSWKGSREMNLIVWLPLLFGLGLGSLVLCLLFVDACERI
jgi:hypothetical protein